MTKSLASPTTLDSSSSRIINRIALANRRLGVLSQSLSTGLNGDASVINQTFGRSANNLVGLNNAVIGAAVYTKSALDTASSILDTVAEAYQDASEKAASIAALPDDKFAALQVALNNSKKQGADTLENARFDGRKLFDGGLREMQVQTGANPTQVTTASIVKATGTSIVRSSVASKLGQWMVDNVSTATNYAFYSTYYDDTAQLAEAVTNGRNVFNDALLNTAVSDGGATGAGNTALVAANIGDIVNAVGADDIGMMQFLDKALPNWTTAINGLGNTSGFYDSSTNTIVTSANIATVYANATRKEEFDALVKDDVATTIYQVGNTAAQNEAARAITLDVTQNTVNVIERMRSDIIGNAKNITASMDILAKANEVTKEVGESFLNADVTDIAQQFAKTLQSMKVDGNLMRANTTKSSTVYNAVAAQLQASQG